MTYLLWLLSGNFQPVTPIMRQRLPSGHNNFEAMRQRSQEAPELNRIDNKGLYRGQRDNQCSECQMKALPAAILSKNLRESDIPSGFKDWSQVIEFAATLYPQLENVDYHASPGIASVGPASTVVEIRAALLKEYRRYNHFGHYPEQEVFEAAVRAISLFRSKVQSE